MPLNAGTKMTPAGNSSTASAYIANDESAPHVPSSRCTLVQSYARRHLKTYLFPLCKDSNRPETSTSTSMLEISHYDNRECRVRLEGGSGLPAESGTLAAMASLSSALLIAPKLSRSHRTPEPPTAMLPSSA